MKPFARPCLVILIMLGLIGCSAPLNNDETEAKNQVLSLAPLGSNVRLAKPLLEEKGFECQWMTNQAFGESEEKHDYLYCDSTKRANIFTTRRWQVALIHQDELVADAAVNIALTGL